MNVKDDKTPKVQLCLFLASRQHSFPVPILHSVIQPRALQSQIVRTRMEILSLRTTELLTTHFNNVP